MSKDTSYDHKAIEKKWQKKWDKEQLYKTEESQDKPKFYCLDMFPYPSGDGLHVGHPKGYIATDVVSRYKTLCGYTVLHPMGWDAFGLPAENYALKNKVHPRVAVEKNVHRFKEQLQQIGFTYDWTREINTTDPEYYKWTQWIFLKLFEKGLAYESDEPINWCPSCQTGLANEDLENGKCERCGSEVEKKPMRQWVLKMTAYADRLLEDLKLLDWEQEIMEQQRNWIGRKEGINIQYEIEDSDAQVVCFTTRPDTNFGATFIVISPEHELVNRMMRKEIKMDPKIYQEVKEYAAKAKAKSEIERQAEGREKSGVFTGLYAINNLNDSKMPVWISDFVLTTFGTGAVVGVPGHDLRDFQFAKKFDIDIVRVVVGKDGDVSPVTEERQVQEEAGTMVHSDFLDGMDIHEATQKIMDYMESKGYGKRVVHYKMRDWVFSRQRYWGEPIPVVHCDKCGTVAVPEKDLPVRLPEVERYEPTGTGESPLANIEEWVKTTCPQCSGPAKRETNTMPQWAGSSWYYLRYMDPHNDQYLVSPEREKYWGQVDQYVGGAEHATRHLLYARFWHKFLYDIGVVTTIEPFKRLFHVGLILAEDGKKMSKRYGNVISPDEVVEKYGADSLRVYEMFMGPFGQAIAWKTKGLEGTYRFLKKLLEYFESWKNRYESDEELQEELSNNLHIYHPTTRLMYKTIRKVTEDIEMFKFNTAISTLMIFINKIKETPEKTVLVNKDPQHAQIIHKFTIYMLTVHEMRQLLIILSPFAPHLAEELWSRLGHTESIFTAKWPAFDPDLAKDEQIEVAVQVNGKVRGKIVVSPDTSKEEAIAMAHEDQNVKKWITDKKVLNEIYVQGKIVSIVVKDE